MVLKMLFDIAGCDNIGQCIRISPSTIPNPNGGQFNPQGSRLLVDRLCNIWNLKWSNEYPIHSSKEHNSETHKYPCVAFPQKMNIFGLHLRKPQEECSKPLNERGRVFGITRGSMIAK
jgi:hypothetical protein